MLNLTDFVYCNLVCNDIYLLICFCFIGTQMRDKHGELKIVVQHDNIHENQQQFNQYATETEFMQSKIKLRIPYGFLIHLKLT